MFRYFNNLSNDKYIPLTSLVPILLMFFVISLTLAHGPAYLIIEHITLDLSVALGLTTFVSLTTFLLNTAYKI